MKPPQTDGDYQKLLSEVIKKQIIILGPDITLAKARNVAGIEIADDGTVVSLHGDPQLITQKLIEQFTELSGLIVKKTMEPLLANYQTPGAQTNSSTAPSQPNLIIPSQPPSTEQHQLSSDPNPTPNESNTNSSSTSQTPQSTPDPKPVDPISQPQSDTTTPQPTADQPVPPTEPAIETPSSNTPPAPSAPDETSQQTPTGTPSSSTRAGNQPDSSPAESAVANTDFQPSEIPAPVTPTNQVLSNGQSSTEENATLSTSPVSETATDHLNGIAGNHVSDLANIPVQAQTGN